MEKEPPVYSVAKLFDSIAIDADWDKPAWQAIQPLLINNHMGAEPSHRPKVLAKLAWDETALYVIFRVEDRYVRAVAQTYQDPVCLDSCAE
ncbi:MAG TPA: diguanylate cyclase, partial [Lentisphaeria bacterium]|nr:diguanylate cyclase [Lentisphaeria bacterium]